MAKPKYILEELFADLNTFQNYAPGYDASDTFQAYNANAMSVKKEIVDLITLLNWEQIKATNESDELEALRLAFANKLLYKYAIFRVVSDRKNERGDVYKNELEKMQRQYIDNYHSAMDSLLSILSDSSFGYQWADTPIAIMMDGLRIENVKQFQRNYYIDTSFLYFIRTVPIQRNLLITTYNGYYSKLEEKNRLDLKEKLDMALVYNIVADSLCRFDLIEFPSTMHSYFDDNTLSRNGKDERSNAQKVSDKLQQQANETLSNIDLALSESSADVDISTNRNKEGNKYYFFG